MPLRRYRRFLSARRDGRSVTPGVVTTAIVPSKNVNKRKTPQRNSGSPRRVWRSRLVATRERWSTNTLHSHSAGRNWATQQSARSRRRNCEGVARPPGTACRHAAGRREIARPSPIVRMARRLCAALSAPRWRRAGRHACPKCRRNGGDDDRRRPRPDIARCRGVGLRDDATTVSP